MTLTAEQATAALNLAATRALARRQSGLPRIDPVEWIESKFYIPETRRPITLALYQSKALREALSRDPNGLFKYSTIIWSDLKKSAKTSLSAGVMDWMMSNMAYASGKFIANDLHQADARAAKMLRTNLKIHPRPDVIEVPSRNLFKYSNESMVEAIPIDPTGEAGANDDMVCFDELWGAHEEAKERMWTESTLSPTKYGRSFRWVSSYAGFLGESNLLWNLYLQGVDQDAQFPGQGVKFDWCDEFDPPLECYHNDRARLFCLWNTVPRLPWQTADYYAQESATLTLSEFNRVHRNQWSAAVEAFVPIEWWDACKDDHMPAPDPETLCLVGIDAAVSRDCFGIVLVSRREDHVFVHRARAWTPPQGGTLDFTNELEPDDLRYPEGELRSLFRQYNVLEHAYDPMHLSELPKRLNRAGFGFYRPFPQGKDRLVADKQLYDLIRERRIHHDGTLVDLRSHLQNANAETQDDKHLRIVKRAPSLHIDLAVALSMCASRALHYRL